MEADKPAVPMELGGHRIRRALIVEDDAIIAMMIADTLQGAGASDVRVCPGITSALGELSRHKPDLLVLDVHLADRDDGWTMAELVVELTPKPPVIVFSTASPERIPSHIAGLGAVLEKPFTPEQLLAAVHENRRRPGLFARLRDALGADREA